MLVDFTGTEKLAFSQNKNGVMRNAFLLTPRFFADTKVYVCFILYVYIGLEITLSSCDFLTENLRKTSRVAIFWLDVKIRPQQRNCYRWLNRKENRFRLSTSLSLKVINVGLTLIDLTTIFLIWAGMGGKNSSVNLYTMSPCF